MPNPTILLNITRFVANAANQPGAPFCPIAVLGVTTVNGNGTTPLIGFVAGTSDAIWVKSPNPTGGPGGKPLAVDIDIMIVSSPPVGGPNFSLTPTDVRFSKTTVGGDSNGNANFSKSVPVGSIITITDKWTDKGRHGNGSAPVWKFSVAVKDSVSGNTGWVDPTIENADDL